MAKPQETDEVVVLETEIGTGLCKKKMRVERHKMKICSEREVCAITTNESVGTLDAERYKGDLVKHREEDRNKGGLVTGVNRHTLSLHSSIISSTFS